MLRAANKIDFDDMLLLCYELLTQRPDILAMWQRFYEYILIDEFQDINRVQYDIIRLLALPQNNLFIVGDDDQSIYRFRGAKPEIMLNFPNDYPECERVLLDINYRSAADIVEAAGRLISANTKRFPKKILSVHARENAVRVIEFADVKAQNEAIVRELLSYHENGGQYRDVAVLYRTNTQPGALAEKLMEYNIPFSMKDSLPNIYEHWLAKNILAYIRLALGENDRALYFQIMNRPKRYLSREAFKDAKVDLRKVKQYYYSSPHSAVQVPFGILPYVRTTPQMSHTPSPPPAAGRAGQTAPPHGCASILHTPADNRRTPSRAGYNLLPRRGLSLLKAADPAQAYQCAPPHNPCPPGCSNIVSLSLNQHLRSGSHIWKNTERNLNSRVRGRMTVTGMQWCL